MTQLLARPHESRRRRTGGYLAKGGSGIRIAVFHRRECVCDIDSVATTLEDHPVDGVTQFARELEEKTVWRLAPPHYCRALSAAHDRVADVLAGGFCDVCTSSPTGMISGVAGSVFVSRFTFSCRLLEVDHESRGHGSQRAHPLEVKVIRNWHDQIESRFVTAQT